MNPFFQETIFPKKIAAFTTMTLAIMLFFAATTLRAEETSKAKPADKQTLAAKSTKITTTTTTIITEDGEKKIIEEKTVTTEDPSGDAGTGKQSAESDPFDTQMKISRLIGKDDKSLFKRSEEISRLSRNLSSSHRNMIYHEHKKDGGVAFALNTFVGLGIGSFVQGDTTGGWTGLLGELGSVTLFYTGYLMLYSGSYYNQGAYYTGMAMFIGGGLSYLAFRIYALVRPWTFAQSYNDKLNEVLSLASRITPYVHMAQLGEPGRTAFSEPVYGAAISVRF